MAINVDDDTMFYGTVTFFWLEYIWCMYVSWRQHKLAKCTIDIPDALKGFIDKTTYDKSRMYTMEKLHFNMISKTYRFVLSLIGLYAGILARIWYFTDGLNLFKNEIILNCFYMFIVLTLQFVSELIPSIYRTFIIESSITDHRSEPKFYIIDHIKTFTFYQVCFLPISSLTVIIVKYCGEYFYFWLWIAEEIYGFIAIKIYPSFIAPMFDEYTVLPKGELRTKTEQLAKEVKYPRSELYIVHRRKRTVHSREHFYGMFDAKRIAIYNYLLDNGELTNDAIVASLAHEFGHWFCAHPTKTQMVLQIHLLILFALFTRCCKSPEIYKLGGFTDNAQPILAGFNIMLNYVTLPYNILFQFLQNCLLRQFEYQADAFASKLVKGEDLKLALVQTYKHTLSLPVQDKFYAAWYADHPSLVDRVHALDEANTN